MFPGQSGGAARNQRPGSESVLHQPDLRQGRTLKRFTDGRGQPPYELARAAVTRYHKLGGSKQLRDLFSHSWRLEV